jgi:creatinine amidohydrolase/Fe(II)-dependent formamide hydrolase-like protein
VSYAVDELPWPEVARILSEDPRLIFPVGALEQHGPQLPCGTNATLAGHVAAEVSERLGILRAPIFSYGVAVGRGPFPGPAGLRRKTFHRAVNELLSRWQDDGVLHFVVITAHRFEPHLEALLMTPSVLASKSVYDLYQIDVSDILESDPELEHAGELETSLMMHLAPEVVRLSEARDFLPRGPALRKYTRRRVPTPPLESGGVLGAPSLASADKGARIFDRWVEAIAEAVHREGLGEPERSNWFTRIV